MAAVKFAKTIDKDKKSRIIAALEGNWLMPMLDRIKRPKRWLNALVWGLLSLYKQLLESLLMLTPLIFSFAEEARLGGKSVEG